MCVYAYMYIDVRVKKKRRLSKGTEQFVYEFEIA